MTEFPYYFTWSNQPRQEPFPVERTEHDEFVLQDGRRVYDFISTSFQASFGHNHPRILSSIHGQLDQMPIASPKATFPLKQDVSQRLIERLGLSDGKLFFTVSGSESVENALKVARQVTGRNAILARRKSYHGASLGALSVTGDWRNAPHFTVDAETIRIPEPAEDPHLEQTRRVIREHGRERIAAMILETISGTNGVAIPSRNWFDGIQSLCGELDILLIIDEVLCGFGRAGTDFAFQHYDLQPDMVCMSKAISGGYIPFGAVWTGPRIVEYYDREKLTCGLTSYAHPLGLAALSGVLDTLADSKFRQGQRELEAVFEHELQKLADRSDVGEIRLRGLLAAIDMVDRPAPSWELCFSLGLHLFSSHQTLILAPPLVSQPARLGQAFRTLQEILDRPIG